MIDETKLTGIVLSVYPIGENDKRLTILTKERGKIQVISRRCRRQNHKLFAVSQPLIYGEFIVSYTRSYVYLNSASCKDSFGDIKSDFDGICYGTYFAEVTEYCTVEMQDERNTLNLLFVTLHALRKKLMPYSLIKSVFEYRILQYIGIGLQVFSCLNCGTTEHLELLSFENGGIFCKNCGKKLIGTHVDEAVLYTLQYVASMPLSQLYTFRLKEEVEIEFCWIVKRFFTLHMDHAFKSEKMLEIE